MGFVVEEVEVAVYFFQKAGADEEEAIAGGCGDLDLVVGWDFILVQFLEMECAIEGILVLVVDLSGVEE